MNVCIFVAILNKIYIGRNDVSVEIFIREAVKSRKDHSFLTAGSRYG